MKVYIITYWSRYEHWGAIESVYTSKKKAVAEVDELNRIDKDGYDYDYEGFETSK